MADADLPLLDALGTTRAIRRYRPDPIPEGDLATILWAATRAPTGSNRQGVRFIVLRDGPVALRARHLLAEGARTLWSDKRDRDGYGSGSGALDDSPKARMARTMDHFVQHFHEAPVIVLGCLWLHRKPTLEMGGHLFPACQNLLLAARALGYGGVLTGFHNYCGDELRDVLGLPPADEVALGCTIPLGVPAGQHGPVRRRPLREVVYEDRWEGDAPWALDPEGSRFTAPGPPSGLRK